MGHAGTKPDSIDSRNLFNLVLMTASTARKELKEQMTEIQ